MLNLFVLLAQQEAPAEGPPIFSFLPMIMILMVLYIFIVVRPSQKEQERRKTIFAALKKNDRVVNSGGIIGIVDSIKDKEDEVVLKGGVHILKSSIVRVIAPDEPVKESQES